MVIKALEIIGLAKKLIRIFLQDVKWKVKVAQSRPTFCNPMAYTVHGILQARILEWVAFPFSRGIFPTQELIPGLPYCRWILYQLSHHGCPRILQWVSYVFFRGSSCPRNWTGVSCTAGGFFTNWATREAHKMLVKVAQSSPTLQPHGLYSPWNSPGQNTGLGSLSLLQGIFPTQGLNPDLPHCRWILYRLRHQGNPMKQKWTLELAFTVFVFFFI